MPEGTPASILLASSEVVGYAKTGGLADVAGALPVALAKRGHRTAAMNALGIVAAAVESVLILVLLRRGSSSGTMMHAAMAPLSTGRSRPFDSVRSRCNTRGNGTAMARTLSTR